MTFDEAFDKLLGHEGDFSDDPRDPGGATQLGVTQRVARAAGYTGDMRTFPQGMARTIYLRDYWGPAGCDALPDAVRFHVFDAAVNSGVGQAIKWLQAAVGEVQDGVIGPRTLQAVGTMPPDRLVRRYSATRLEFMASLPTWPAFGRGWARRIASNLMEA